MASTFTLYNNTKPIKTINPYTFYRDMVNKVPYEFSSLNYYGKTTGILYPISVSTAATAFKKQHVSSMPTGGTLFFDKTSKFPRIKLTNTAFKRTIKINNCDYIVVNEDALNKMLRNNAYIELNLYETEDGLYDVPTLKSFSEQRRIEVVAELGLSNTEDIIDYFIKTKWSNEDVNHLNGTKYYITSSVAEDNFLYNYIIGTYNNKVYITDNELDKIVNKTLDDLTNEDINSFNDMFNSTDSDVVDMALKLLTNYNTDKYPFTVTTLFNLHISNINKSPVWNSVNVKRLRDSINYTEPNYTAFPACIRGMGIKAKNYAEDDVKQAFVLSDARFDLFQKEIEQQFDKILAEKGIL